MPSVSDLSDEAVPKASSCLGAALFYGFMFKGSARRAQSGACSGCGDAAFLIKKGYMMKKLFLSLFWCAVSWLQVSAQQTFVDKLVKPVSGQGTVRVIQDAEITRMVNGGGAGKEYSASSADPGRASRPEAESGNPTAGAKSARKMKANGYRIQVYAGGNSRTARQEAQRMAGKVKSYFSDMATYTHFQSPRWICRVGDFRTYEEADQALRELRATKQFDEALIVKSVIQIPY